MNGIIINSERLRRRHCKGNTKRLMEIAGRRSVSPIYGLAGARFGVFKIAREEETKVRT